MCTLDPLAFFLLSSNFQTVGCHRLSSNHITTCHSICSSRTRDFTGQSCFHCSHYSHPRQQNSHRLNFIPGSFEMEKTQMEFTLTQPPIHTTHLNITLRASCTGSSQSILDLRY
ncbi:hypothetical protein BLNAU_19609 [Blattamonas nauphoetae]|uniref:Uncharacterized protein n=1 Tax=Blattamonas nauphoetae TaxID=2049346 RepID=A0ABQ9X1C5_9EUKA|nr:hypothetical protein BLNAU_19609 [Blattamonas nauphoetae]